MAALKYVEKHYDDFAKLLPSGGGDPSLLADVAALVKKHFPQYNPNDLIDDTLALIKAETAPDVQVVAASGMDAAVFKPVAKAEQQAKGG
jgi:hypothetical protein